MSDTEIRQIAADLTEGRPPMVWFTADAVGVPEGRSGKVLALGDPTEGDFLQVRPTGSKDVLSFSPTEVTLTKPARVAAAKPRKDTAVSMPSVAPSSVSAAPVASSPNPDSGSSADTRPAAPPNGAANHGAAQQDSSSSASKSGESAAKPAPAKQPARPAREKSATPARKPKAAEVTVTLSGTADGEWTVDVVNGKKRTVRGLSVSGSAVAQAAKLLHPEVSEVVDSVLDSVRDSQRTKVELLQAELEQARKILDELQG